MHPGQGVRDERPERPVGRRGSRLGSLVVECEEQGVDQLCVGLVVRGHVDGLAVAGLNQPHLQAVLAARLRGEVSQPGVGLGDREVTDVGVAQCLDVGVAEGRVHADLGGELLELRVLVLGDERRRDAVGPQSALRAGHRVAVEHGVAGVALGLVREQVAGLDGQAVRVTGLLGCDCCPHETGGCCHAEAEARHYDEGGRRQYGGLPRPEQRHDCGDAEQDECAN